jgi:hypothetical protein
MRKVAAGGNVVGARHVAARRVAAMRTLARLALAVTLASVVACAPPRVGTPTADGDLVFVGQEGALLAVDPARGLTAFTVGGAVPSADWSRLFATAPGAGRLTTLDAASGRERASRPVADDLRVRVVSGSGRLAALAPAAGDGASLWLPPGRERTGLVVASPDGADEPRRYDLVGNFEPEAFSADDRVLYLLEYLPPLAPDRYRVRALELGDGKLREVLTRSKQANLEEMRGQGRVQVLAPDRRTLYTLYTRQPDHLHAREMAAGRTDPNHSHAFVHVLSLAEGWTYCVDLPPPFGIGQAAGHALAVAPDGRSIYVLDGAGGKLVRIDARDLVVDRAADLTPDPAAGRGAALAVDRAGRLYLAGPGGLTVLGADDLGRRERWTVPGGVGGAAVSADGRRLYLGAERGLLIVDTATGRELGTVPLPPLATVQHVGRAA